MRRFSSQTGPVHAPSVVHDVLRSKGDRLAPAIGASFGARFGYDFSGVRVHTDANAAHSARAVNAAAYTVGNRIVFDQGRYEPDTSAGRALIAHELTHVVQQGGSDPTPGQVLPVDTHDSRAEAEARRVSPGLSQTNPRVARADPVAVGYTMDLGGVARTGIQFVPRAITDTQVGPVTVQGGLYGSGQSQLGVVIGQDLTIRTLAIQLRALWTTATPFTPPGAVAPTPLVMVTADELARALLVFNRTYLPVPAMTNWRAGLRYPLPVEIDDTTGVATLHPLLIQALAGAFDPAWEPLLDRRAAATPVPQPAALQTDVQAFLARETTALARGTHLRARALTNAVAELPFVRETFRQVGAAAFDVALAFMDNAVNREITILARQRDGAAILAEIRNALAATPAAPSAAQQASLARANGMLAAVAGIAAVAPPIAARNRPERTVTIDTVSVGPSNQNPATAVTIANAIFAQCNVRLNHRVNATASAAQAAAWLGADNAIRRSPSCGSISGEERTSIQQATAAFGLGSRIRAFFVPAVHDGTRAYSVPPFCGTGAAAARRNVAWVSNLGDHRTLAHEIGHVLLNSGAHPDPNLMGPGAAPAARARINLIDAQCATIHGNAA